MKFYVQIDSNSYVTSIVQADTAPTYTGGLQFEFDTSPELENCWYDTANSTFYRLKLVPNMDTNVDLSGFTYSAVQQTQPSTPSV